MKVFNRFTWMLFLSLRTAACFSQTPMDLYPAALEGKWGFIDKNGRTVIPFQYKRTWFDPYKTLNAVSDEKGKMLIDNEGKPLTGDHYEAFFYSNGTKFISVLDSAGLWGCIDTAGKLVIPCQYPESIHFTGGIATVKKDSIQGYYDTDLMFTRIEGFDDLFAANEGFIIVMNGKGRNIKRGVFDTKTGRITVPPVYYSIGLIKNGHAVVTKNNGDGIVDVRTGKLTVKLRKKQRISTSVRTSDIDNETFLDDLYDIRRKDRVRIINFEGKQVVSLDKKYRAAHVLGFYNGCADVILGGREGLINNKGKVLIEPAYDRLGIVWDGLISVKREKKCGIVDTSGRIVVPLQYDEAFLYKGLIVCVLVTKDPSSEEETYFFSYMDRDGNLVWPASAHEKEK